MATLHQAASLVVHTARIPSYPKDKLVETHFSDHVTLVVKSFIELLWYRISSCFQTVLH